MGTPVPDEWPELEDAKFYLVYLDAFQDVGPDNDCTQDYQLRQRCCTTGQHIKAWLAVGWECLSPHELCVVSGFTAQRLLNVHGPYDNLADCQADL